MKKLLMSALLPLLCLTSSTVFAEPQATLSGPPAWTFGANWSVTLTGQPLVGGPLRIVYDLSRLPQCRGASWAITGYAMTNHGPVQSFPVADASTVGTSAEVLLDLTTGGDLEVWFQETDSNGCSAWDSNVGWNFHTQVWQDPTLTFNEGWTHSLFGTLQGGTTLMVDYDIDRLGQCRAYYMNYKAWGVYVNYRFNGGPVTSLPLTVSWGEWNLEFWKQVPAFIPLPQGPATLEMWFSNIDRKNCEAYDSRYGQNYVFTVQ
ncbi:DUF6209 family protein [Myxococcus sp. RHSTA-1-4]|uniref:DUF6209 family protein n=1 Tax=Myxococcus sp. RHSTA-1-4 TaxID=2874601 RepID=UPI001CBCB21F|nr:DUF6209 family protein [Myxococcus sp. RHSTA-1-4]MBZ4418959.1 DUF6209 family protein [Myxococcus sp. RHSTA-1-4]